MGWAALSDGDTSPTTAAQKLRQGGGFAAQEAGVANLVGGLCRGVISGCSLPGGGSCGC